MKFSWSCSKFDFRNEVVKVAPIKRCILLGRNCQISHVENFFQFISTCFVETRLNHFPNLQIMEKPTLGRQGNILDQGPFCYRVSREI